MSKQNKLMVNGIELSGSTVDSHYFVHDVGDTNDTDSCLVLSYGDKKLRTKSRPCTERHATLCDISK